jgi:hypothetical protein
MKYFFASLSLIVTGLLLSPAHGAEQQKSSPTEKAPAKEAVPAKVPDTLMFTIDELNEIQTHAVGVNPEDAEKEVSGIESATLYLSTILYFSPTDWTIWVNGVPISPDQEFKAFKVTQITPSYVELLIPLSAQGMRPIRLGPNQTFVTRSGIVVEGRVP